MKEAEQKLTVAFSANKFAERREQASVFEHNLEFAARINRVNYINDSKATTVEETWNSLNVMTEDITLILGGTDRKSDYGILKNLVKEKVRAVICLGSERERIFKAFMDSALTVHAQTMEEAVKLAAIIAKPGSTVLFSPGCPSYDAFDNYKNRGNKFKHLVSAINIQ